MKDGIFMTEQEKNRADLFSQISQEKISQSEAARQLGLSLRHVQRLYALYLLMTRENSVLKDRVFSCH